MNTNDILKQKDKMIRAIMDEPIKVKKLRLIELLWDFAIKTGKAKALINTIEGNK